MHLGRALTIFCCAQSIYAKKAKAWDEPSSDLSLRQAGLESTSAPQQIPFAAEVWKTEVSDPRFFVRSVDAPARTYVTDFKTAKGPFRSLGISRCRRRSNRGSGLRDLSEKAMCNSVRGYLAHHHTERNRRGLENELIVPLESPADLDAEVKATERLGGLLDTYRRAA